MIHHVVVVILEVSAKELHHHIDTSILIKDPFCLLPPTETSSCSTKLNWLGVNDTEC